MGEVLKGVELPSAEGKSYERGPLAVKVQEKGIRNHSKKSRKKRGAGAAGWRDWPGSLKKKAPAKTSAGGGKSPLLLSGGGGGGGDLSRGKPGAETPTEKRGKERRVRCGKKELFLSGEEGRGKET